MVRRLFLGAIFISIFSFILSAQVLEQRWITSTISVEPGSTGNNLYSLILIWNAIIPPAIVKIPTAICNQRGIMISPKFLLNEK